jgi:GntR family transcriptional regulator, transcriptional repressor for pyruvate dehydrogenase complex
LLKRETLTSQVVDHVIGLIQSGQVKPGEKLPIEKELVETLGVSRTCVREAMRALEILGLVSVRPKHGPVVLEPASTAMFHAQHFSTVAHLQQSDLLVEFRMILEVGLASLAAQKATPDDLAAMRKALKDYRDAVDDNNVHQADIAFHKAIADATKNSIAIMVLETISSPLLEQMRRVNTFPIPVRGAQEDHLRIYKAIEERNPEKARGAMRAHLTSVEQNIRIAKATAASSPNGDHRQVSLANPDTQTVPITS